MSVAVAIPGDWQSLSWQERRSLASQLSDEPITNGEQANAAIIERLAYEMQGALDSLDAFAEDGLDALPDSWGYEDGAEAAHIGGLAGYLVTRNKLLVDLLADAALVEGNVQPVVYPTENID